MELSVGVGKTQPIKRGGDQYSSHLLFANDMLLFSKGSVVSLKEIDTLLEALAMNTGLRINKEKRKVFFSNDKGHKEELKAAIGVYEGKLPIKYLGIPLSVNYLKARNYTSLIDKCRGRIEDWCETILLW